MIVVIIYFNKYDSNLYISLSVCGLAHRKALRVISKVHFLVQYEEYFSEYEYSACLVYAHESCI